MPGRRSPCRNSSRKFIATAVKRDLCDRSLSRGRRCHRLVCDGVEVQGEAQLDPLRSAAMGRALRFRSPHARCARQSLPMKTFTLDLHHVVLYGLLAIVSLGGLSVLHSLRIDISAAKTQSEADVKIIQDRDRSEAERAKQYEAQLELIQKLRVTSKTPPAAIG